MMAAGSLCRSTPPYMERNISYRRRRHSQDLLDSLYLSVYAVHVKKKVETFARSNKVRETPVCENSQELTRFTISSTKESRRKKVEKSRS